MAAQGNFIRLIALDQLSLDEGVRIDICGRELAVFRLSEPAGVYAIDNTCPHAGGNLSDGDVMPGGVIRCPWHAWTFRLTDGESADGTPARVNAYPVEVRGQDVYIKLAPKLPSIVSND